jgi:hypothetical protein
METGGTNPLLGPAKRSARRRPEGTRGSIGGGMHHG